MSEYDFGGLSPYDFEMLCRDLLQCHLKIHLQSFKTGRDKGIDLRYAPTADNALVVQCKHYSQSSFSTLFSHLQKTELPKVKALAPDRYILATSLGLTPGNAKDIADLFAPYCQSPQDVYGKQDLNNLLGRFPEIEKAHYKLWLTSTPVLERVLYNSIYTQTALDQEEIHTKLKVYVRIGSLEKAASILHDTHTCIISGIPGIGKTTLAQILLTKYLMDGWEVVTVRQNVKDALDRYSPDPNKKQIIWYDDFLGQISLGDKLVKNEDHTLVQLISALGKQQNRRFLLTTREYIYKQAMQRHEVLAKAEIELHRHLLDLSGYSRLDKAQILLNHLYFYNVPQEHINALLASRTHLKIIDHRNYSPRIIEWLTNARRASSISPAEYPTHFMATLDNPATLWQHAFENQISETARNLLLVLLSMGQETLLDLLRTAFASHQTLCKQKYNATTSPLDFVQCLRELDGTFVAIKKYDDLTSVALHNPSVADFLVQYLRKSPQLISDILDSCCGFDQLSRIFNLITDSKPTAESIAPLKPQTCKIVSAIQRTIASDSTRITFAYGSHQNLQPCVATKNEAIRLIIAISMAELFPDNGLREFLKERLRQYTDALLATDANRSDLVDVLDAVEQHEWHDDAFVQELLGKTTSYLLGDPNAWEELRPVAAWVNDHRTQLQEHELNNYLMSVSSFIPSEIRSFTFNANNQDMLEEMQGDLLEIESALGIPLGDHIDYLEEHRKEARIPDADDDREFGFTAPRTTEASESDIESLFDSLHAMPQLPEEHSS